MKIKINSESKIEHPLLAHNAALFVEWKYADEMDEPNWRHSYIVVADDETELGKEINNYLETDEPDFIHLDQTLTKAFGIKDTDVVFYITSLTDYTYEEVAHEVEASNDMIINEFIETIKEKGE